MSEKKAQAALPNSGLRGHVAGTTSICTVAAHGHSGLTYYGYDVKDLAQNCIFEEVAFLLLEGELPDPKQLEDFQNEIQAHRELPDTLKSVLELIPADAHPMDVLRSGVSLLGNLNTEVDFANQRQHAIRILAALPGIVTYWYRFANESRKIQTAGKSRTLGGQFLELLHGSPPSALHEEVMNVSLILYAEHEFNASTFTARVCASTLSDIHSCITGAIGSLRGHLHGGANEAAMDMIESWNSPAEAEAGISGHVSKKRKDHGLWSRGLQRVRPSQRCDQKVVRKTGRRGG